MGGSVPGLVAACYRCAALGSPDRVPELAVRLWAALFSTVSLTERIGLAEWADPFRAWLPLAIAVRRWARRIESRSSLSDSGRHCSQQCRSLRGSDSPNGRIRSGPGCRLLSLCGAGLAGSSPGARCPTLGDIVLNSVAH